MLAILLALLLIAGLMALVVYSFPQLVLRVVVIVVAAVLFLAAGYFSLRLNFDRQMDRVSVAFAAPSEGCASGLELSVNNQSGRDVLYVEGDIQGFEPGHSRPKIEAGVFNDLRLESDLIVPARTEGRICRETLPWSLVKDSIMSRQETVDPAAYQWEVANLRLCLQRNSLERLLGFSAFCDV